MDTEEVDMDTIDAGEDEITTDVNPKQENISAVSPSGNQTISPEEKNKLLSQLSVLKKDIMSIKAELNAINEEKEAAFSKKEEHSRKVGEIIGGIKRLKRERDEFTKKVQTMKTQRRQLNETISKKIAEIKVLYDERDKITAKNKFKEDPSLLKKEIEKMEYRIETEVMPFDREQKLMKAIKEKRAHLEGMKGAIDVIDKINVLSKEINTLKKDANLFHREIQKNASESQRLHELMIVESKKVDELKTDEEKVYQVFFEHKKKFTEVNNNLKDKLSQLNKINDRFDEARVQARKDKKKKVQETLVQKEMAVAEKIKKGLKLTTEDLLVFQREQLSSDDTDEKPKRSAKKKGGRRQSKMVLDDIPSGDDDDETGEEDTD